jgi:hypothetical protein
VYFQQLTGFLTSNILFDLTVVLDYWKFDSPICLNDDDPRPPFGTDLNNVMQSVREFYQRVWPAVKYKAGRERRLYTERSIFCVKICSGGSSREGFAGILSPDLSDPNAFWSISYRISDFSVRQELSRVRVISQGSI